MPHQDMDDLCTLTADLKGLLEPVLEIDVSDIKRHGNSKVSLVSTAILALLTYGWSRKAPICERFEEALKATQEIWRQGRTASSPQAMLVVLRRCGAELIERVRSGLIAKIRAVGNWELWGRPTFAVDGSKFAVPRTKQNLEEFAAASKKSKGAYKDAANLAKAMTTQVLTSLCMHLPTGLPMFWKLGGASDSERGLLMQMLDSLPERSRLVFDAHYVGYEFWKGLMERGFTFVVRTGKNVKLLSAAKVLSELNLQGTAEHRDDLMLYWPESAQKAGKAPLILRLVQLKLGRGKRDIFLVTNELDLTIEQLTHLYASRWGVEVFFRTVKQSFDRAVLQSRTPENTLQELNWTLMGVWLALWAGRRHVPLGSRMSPINVLRTVCDLVSHVAAIATGVTAIGKKLAQCTLLDESGRKSPKDSNSPPRKKRHRPTGVPQVAPIPPPLEELLNRQLV